MGLFSRKRREQREPAGWYPVQATCGPDDRPPTVLYFHPELLGAVVGITVYPVIDGDGAPRVAVTADWQIRRAPRYIAADVEWHLTRSEYLTPPAYESSGEAAADAAVIVRWLLRGASPAEMLADLASDFASLICNWDGQPFEQDAEAV